MHEVVRKFAKKHESLFRGNILDVGSFDVNGSLRDTIAVSIGIDMRAGPGVDMVVNSSDLLKVFEPESFDGVVSGDALEHTQDWKAAMVNMWGVLKPGGPLLLTLANPKKGFHGYPDDFHRWHIKDFVKIFDGQEIIGTFDEFPSMGVVVKKCTQSLNLTIEPMKVERRK